MTQKKRFKTYTPSGEIGLFTLQLWEDLQELLQESDKLLSQIIIVLDGRGSLGETSPNRLFDIQHAG